MKNKGFTLIELLAVLLILAIILTITIYSVSSILNTAEESLSEAQIARIKESARVYYIEEGMNLEYNTEYTDKVCVDTDYLLEKNYIDLDDIKDPKTNGSIKGSILIIKDSTSNGYTYTFRQTTTCQSEYN